VKTVTGGGPFPSLAGAPVAECAGDGRTDDTACLQKAIDAAALAHRPLLLPAKASAYRITSALRVTTSLIGIRGMPVIQQTATCATARCAMLRLAEGMSGWIHNLHLVGAYVQERGAFAHNISVGGVDGVTIQGNLLERPLGDNVADNAQEQDGAPARNVLVAGNTLLHPARCAISLVNVADRWAVLDNVLSDDEPWVSPIDLEPWRPASRVTNVEVGYNQVTTGVNPRATAAGDYVGVVTASGWWDPNPGGNVYVHHNYGSWPFRRFVAQAGRAGTFGNVVDVDNMPRDERPR
jgi:hypothetical protein